MLDGQRRHRPADPPLVHRTPQCYAMGGPPAAGQVCARRTRRLPAAPGATGAAPWHKTCHIALTLGRGNALLGALPQGGQQGSGPCGEHTAPEARARQGAPVAAVPASSGVSDGDDHAGRAGRPAGSGATGDGAGAGRRNAVAAGLARALDVPVHPARRPLLPRLPLPAPAGQHHRLPGLLAVPGHPRQPVRRARQLPAPASPTPTSSSPWSTRSRSSCLQLIFAFPAPLAAGAGAQQHHQRAGQARDAEHRLPAPLPLLGDRHRPLAADLRRGRLHQPGAAQPGPRTRSTSWPTRPSSSRWSCCRASGRRPAGARSSSWPP